MAMKDFKKIFIICMATIILGIVFGCFSYISIFLVILAFVLLVIAFPALLFLITMWHDHINNDIKSVILSLIGIVISVIAFVCARFFNVSAISLISVIFAIYNIVILCLSGVGFLYEIRVKGIIEDDEEKEEKNMIEYK